MATTFSRRAGIALLAAAAASAATAATAARRNAPEIQMHDLPCEALAENANTQGGITWMH